MTDVGKRLEPWMNKPKYAPVILETLEQAERPLLLREIRAATGFPLQRVASTMDRLHRKGMVTRWKVPITDPTHGCAPGGQATRDVWLYELVKE